MKATNSFQSTIIYINYDATLDIVKQTSLITFFINKLNLRLIRASNYLQRFNLNIRYKLNKQHIVLDALLRLVFANVNAKVFSNDILVKKGELDALFVFAKAFRNYNLMKQLKALFIVVIVSINEVFCKQIIDNYFSDFN